MNSCHVDIISLCCFYYYFQINKFIDSNRKTDMIILLFVNVSFFSSLNIVFSFFESKIMKYLYFCAKTNIL